MMYLCLLFLFVTVILATDTMPNKYVLEKKKSSFTFTVPVIRLSSVLFPKLVLVLGFVSQVFR